MPTVEEMSSRYAISLKKLRRMERDGVLNVEAGDPTILQMLSALRSGNQLSVSQCVDLLTAPALFAQLGGYETKARGQLALLGSVVVPAPDSAAMAIVDAAAYDAGALERLADWIKATIPEQPCTHHYLAVRLLLGVQTNLRQYEAPRIPRAFLNVRKSGLLAGWFEIVKQRGKNATIYHRPKGFDL